MGRFQTDEEIVEHVKTAINDAVNGTGKLANSSLLASGILNFFGMSGKRTRILLNSLGNKRGMRYAEVGTHMGSTLFSVLYENDMIAACCDNWSEFSGPRDVFIQNVNIFIAGQQSKDHKISLFDQDFRTLKFGEEESWSGIDFYNYDGPHRTQDQYDGIVLAYPGLAERFILFVDDWNWPGPRDGTLSALESLGVEILFKQEIMTPDEILNAQGAAINRFQNSEWHNGIAVFACKKPR
jgi:hypothetical protein